MRVPSAEFQEYLAPDESVVEAGTGALVENASRSEGSIGITDRRLLFVSEDDGFMGISRDGIHSVRSRPGSTAASHDDRYRLAAVAGALIAVPAFVAVLALGSSGLATVLALVTVGGLAAAEFLRRGDVDPDWDVRADLGDLLPDRLGNVELLSAHLDDARDVDRQQFLVLASALVGLTALAGLVAVTADLLTIPLTLVTLGGVAAMDYAHRRGRDAARVERTRPAARTVSVHLDGGRVIDFRVDSAERFDHALSRVTAERANGNVPAALSEP